MKKQLFLSLFLVSALVGFSQMENEKPYMTKSYDQSVKNVEATTSGGNISVYGVNSNTRIEVYISGNNGQDLSDAEIKQRLDELYDLDVSVSGDKVKAIVRNKKKITDWKRALNISFKVFVAPAASTDLTTSGGNIVLENLSGDQNFSTSGGNLNIAKVSGKLRGRTSGGNIHLEDSKDNIDLSTSGGNVYATNCSGDLKLTTSGGDVVLEGLKGTTNATTSGGNVKGKNISGELKAHTSGGNVRLSDLNCSLESSTNGGNIDVAFNDIGKFIKLSNSGGNITLTVPKTKGLDLDLSGDISKTNFENFSGKIDENLIRGKLNGGGIPVTVDANSGKVKLELK